ncbi:hypothetical protein C7M84_008107 [Penaeus vannamei]|uniref:Uncharacterized protein n=1 Tax=Penaeus vannamei TaxID=6689 RepID=A0A423TAN5_PENVA|nr:hypothetical protein C7M84_008107 [Penaeus vannamei]
MTSQGEARATPNELPDIQSWWELPSIAHFCSLFRAAFDLLDFDIEELEEALLTDGLDDTGSPLLVELTVRLVQGCLPGKTVNATNYQSYLRKLFKHKCQEDPTRENLFKEGDLRYLPLRRKVEILHAVCDFRLEAEDVLDLLKNLESDSLRVEPLGMRIVKRRLKNQSRCGRFSVSQRRTGII